MKFTQILLLIIPAIIFSYPSPNFFFPGFDFTEMKSVEISKDTAAIYVSDSKVFSECVKFDRVKSDTNSHFYSIDIDNDKVDELVYMGGICAEGGFSVIWKKTKSGFAQSSILVGDINGIIFKGKDTAYISTFAHGCCADDCNYVNLFIRTKDTTELIKVVTLFHTVELPTSNTLNKRISIQNPLYSLRSSPVKNDKPDSSDYEKYGVFRGNVIAELPKGIVANVTSSTQDSTGRIWWFSIVENFPEMQYGVYGKGDNVCGWISTKKLDYTEIKQ